MNLSAVPPVMASDQNGEWVVDLASHRVVRGHVSKSRVPIATATGQPREMGLACSVAGDSRALPDPNGVARGGAIRAGRVGKSQINLRYETVSRPQQSPASFTRADVEVRAYSIYCTRAKGEGLDVDDWLEAERQLMAEAESAAPTATAAADAEPTGADEAGSD